MPTRNHSRLAAVMITCSLAATAHAAPPTSGGVKPEPQLIARAAPDMSTPAPRTKPAPIVPAQNLAASDKPLTAAERASMLRSAETKLASEEVETVEQGFALLAQLGGAEAIKIMVARVRRGLPPQLLAPAVEVLVSFHQPSVAPVLLELTLHRRWQVRAAAIDALGRLGAKTAQPSLLYALDDPSAEVRSTAVQSLGLVGDARALPALTVAMQRNVEGAALALGKLGNSKESELLLERVRKGDVASVESGLHAMLLRANLPLALKLKIVNELAQVDSPNAREVLTVWTQTWTTGDARVLQALKARTKQSEGAAVAAQSAAVPAKNAAVASQSAAASAGKVGGKP